MENQEAFGHTLLVDKPLEWTSFDLVNKLRYAAKHITGRKKIKVGHAGTLDPLASGLMIICVGKHTKSINDYMGLDKQYTGTFLLGATTPSYDLETEIDARFDLPANDAGLMQSTAAQFLGEIEQVPPIFSAKKIDGKKAYELARKGKSVEMKASRVHIKHFDLDLSNFPEVAFTLDCSKGTYVRSLAHDFGKALGSGAHLTSLRRTKVGDLLLENAHSIEEARDALQGAWNSFSQKD
jgi:tRNA pseudouridine55 synthase